MLILNIGCGNQTLGDIRVDRYPSETTTHIVDAEAGLPFCDASFDEVYSSFLLEHLRNPFSALKEMVRVCKPRGRITVITDNASFLPHYFPITGLSSHCGYEGRGRGDRHYAIFTKEHLHNHFEALGLQPLEIRYTSDGYRLSAIARLFDSVEIFRRFVNPWLIAVGTKAREDEH